MKKTLLLMVLILSAAGQAHAQLGQRVSVVQNAMGEAIPSITVTACAYNAGQYSLIGGIWTYTGAIPCTPKVPVFADPAGANPVNPVLSSGNGNYSYWVSPANYTECIAGAQINSACYLIQIGGIGGGGGGGALPAAPGLSVQFANLSASAFASVTGLGVDSIASPTLLTIPLALTVSGSPLTVGNPTFKTGQVNLAGLGNSFLATVEAISSSKNWCFELPANEGSSGQLLTSAGGCGASMTWTPPSVTINTTTPLGGGGGLVLGGSITLTCPTCLVQNGSVSATSLPLSNSGFADTLSAVTLTGNHVITFPDVTGLVCLTTTCTANFYQTFQANGTPLTQETTANFVASTNMTITPSIVGGVTTLTFVSTNTAATAWSAITAATNANAGTFLASGNSWDWSAATTWKMPTAGWTQPGSGSGLISFLTQAAAGTYNWNWPITAGTAGFLVTTQGGAGAAMTYTSNLTTINGTSCAQGSSCTAIQLQTNTVANASQSLLNLINSSSNTDGLTLTFTNTGTGVVKAEIAGLLNSTGGGTGVSAPLAHGIPVSEGINAFNFIPSPTVNGFYVCGFNVFASAAVDPTCTLQGVAIVANAGTPVTLTSAANAALEQFTSGSAQNVTGPPLANNTTFAMYVTGAGGVIYTPATGTCNGNATCALPFGSFAIEYTDNSNTQLANMPTYKAFVNTAANQALTFNSTTNVISFLGNIAIGPASSTNGDLACWNGTTGLLLSDCGSLGTNLISSASTQTSGAIAIGAGTKTLGAPLAATGADYIVIASGAGVWTQTQVNGGADCGDATHAVKFTAATELFGCQAITVSAAAGGNANTIQWNNAAALGGIVQWTTNGTTTITGAATAVLDLSAMAPTAGLKLPTVAGAIPTADGFIGVNSTLHALVFGSNGTTIVTAAAATGTNANTTCSNQFVRAISSIVAPTCNTVTGADLAVVQTRRVCDIAFGDTSASVLTNAQLGPQKRVCFIPYAATVVEVDVAADAGTPNIIVGRSRAGATSNLLSGALATAASGGIACSNTGGTTGLDGATTCSATLQNTGTNIGDYFEAVSGTAGGTAKFMTVHIVYTVN